MAEHTKGQWAVDGHDYSGIVISAPGRNATQIVCVVQEAIGYNADTTAEAEANARLISAAPDLLAACKAALMDDMAATLMLKEAIARAGG